MKKHTRFFALLLATLLAFVLLFSTAYIIAEAGHDCVGEHCPVCYQIAVCENSLKQLALGIAAVVIAAVLTYILLSAVAAFAAESRGCTLVSLKIKLSN